jgi:phosphoribosylformylglycinamidine cyclo-ligase
MSLYNKRGVSAQKEEVHAATRNLDTGLYTHSFCRLYPDYLAGEPDWANVMHADGAGTKSILAYLYWKETGDISVWKGIAQDAIVMNLDDLLCTGIYDEIIFNSTIDRNKLRIPGAVLEEIINGNQAFFSKMHEFGIHISYLGGETADVGDVVRTIAVNGTMTARWPREKLITNDKIREGDVIVGLAGFGQAVYEDKYNSGIGSNGLTSARHDLLSKKYAKEYPESFERDLNAEVVYIGKYQLTDAMPGDEQRTVAQHLLSPTRTFAPVIKEILEGFFEGIHGMIHCSGGGQTKCLKYLPAPLRIVKDNLFTPPPVFDLIRESSGSSYEEMYQVFNMGSRMEIYCPSEYAGDIMNIANRFGIEAAMIGRVEAAENKELIIDDANGSWRFGEN